MVHRSIGRAIAGVVALSSLAALCACGGTSTGGPTAANPAATAMPVAKAPSGTYHKGSAANLAPAPDSLERWTPGTFVRASGGPGGAADFEMTGTGESQGSNDLYSPPVSVSAGKTYTFSMWIDPSHVSAGTLVLGVYAPSRSVTYGQVRIKPGPAGRYAVIATIPKDAHQVRIDFQPNSATIEKGQKLRVSQPMLVAGGSTP